MAYRRAKRIAALLLVTWCGQAAAAEPGPSPFGQLSKAMERPAVPVPTKLTYRLLANDEAQRNGLPADLVDAVIAIESGFDASRIGAVGEIGLMQVRPGTAAMLGFRGTDADLAKPAVNIHYGATYLGQAWRLAAGDVCRTLMKYRAGHGEETMTALSALYCTRARAHLAAIGSKLATGSGPVIAAADLDRPAPTHAASAALRPLHGAAFWAAQGARVRAATARIEARWRRMASR